MELLEEYNFGRYSMCAVRENKFFICTYIDSSNIPTEDLVFSTDIDECEYYEFIPCTIGAVLTNEQSKATSRLVPDKANFIKSNLMSANWIGMLTEVEIKELRNYGADIEMPKYYGGWEWDTKFRIQVL